MRPVEKPVEIREAADGKLTLRTLASVTGVWYPIGGGVQEKMVPGCFTRTLKNQPPPDVALRLEHDGLPIARSTSKTGSPTLQLSEVDDGLLGVADLNPRDPDVQSLRAKAEHLDLQASFAFRCNRDAWSDDLMRREVLEVNMHEGDLSIVAFGANSQTTVAVDARGSAFTLEQRKALADRLRGRVAGPGSFVSDSHDPHSAKRSVIDFTTPARQEYDLLCAHEGRSLDSATKGRSAKPSGQASPDLTSAARRDLERLRKG
jgi:HK97 family phage prohead protease